jgi:hypothetical protein
MLGMYLLYDVAEVVEDVRKGSVRIQKDYAQMRTHEIAFISGHQMFQLVQRAGIVDFMCASTGANSVQGNRGRAM